MKILAVERALTGSGRARPNTLVVWCQAPPDAITARTGALRKGLQAGTRRAVMLCDSVESDDDAGMVSVLSSLRWGLLGQNVGGAVFVRRRRTSC